MDISVIIFILSFPVIGGISLFTMIYLDKKHNS